MARISPEALAKRLIDWGVDTVFGLPSDGVNGITEGLRRHQDKLKFVHVHHEEAAAFMAVAHAKMLPGHPGHGGATQSRSPTTRRSPPPTERLARR